MPFPIIYPGTDAGYIERLKKARQAVRDLAISLNFIGCGVTSVLVKQDYRQAWTRLCAALETILSTDIDDALERANQPEPAPTAETLVKATVYRDNILQQLEHFQVILDKLNNELREQFAPVLEILIFPLRERLKEAEADIIDIQAKLEKATKAPLQE